MLSHALGASESEESTVFPFFNSFIDLTSHNRNLYCRLGSGSLGTDLLLLAYSPDSFRHAGDLNFPW